MNRLAFFLLIGLTIVFSPGFFPVFQGTVARANMGMDYGLGAQGTAMGRATSAWSKEAYSAFDNPAQLGVLEEDQTQLSMGLSYLNPEFQAIKDVVVENEFISDKQRKGDVQTEYKRTFGQTLGIELPLTQDIGFGVSLFLPIDQIAFFDTGNAFVPEYTLYRARTQRPQINLGGSYEFLPGFSLGAGVKFGYSLTSKADVFLQTKESKSSSMRFTASMKPKAAPYFGAYLSPPSWENQWSFGTVVRLPLENPNTMRLNAAARAIGDLAALDFQYAASSALFYDPLTVEIGTSFKLFHFWRTAIQVDYQAWGQFKKPAMKIENPSLESCGEANNCGLNISPSQNPDFSTQNIFIPRVAQSFQWGITHFRLGYGYKPSIFSELPEEAGNYLDPPKHMYSGGVGFDLAQVPLLRTEGQLDFFGLYHQLISQSIEKTSGNEAGEDGKKIGAPGYEAGGFIFGGGLNLTLRF